ncbi:uncharacterized protein SCHCODRAFT_01142628 [Schizophyllum commune H4-8]|nr:uncharacterized protein SCHCODRAFT_01142628 [Schizophyllum commune H4-8]KAI5894367.1 hypothetical protein SCHCODRAFT_01142628 [Schizophyllum commune H4-8]
MLPDLALAAAIAVGPRMRSTRDSQAWETGGTMVGTMARTWRGQARPPFAMQNEAGDGYCCSIPCSSDVGDKVVSYDPEPPEARVRTPRAREANVKATPTLAPHSLRLSGNSRQNMGVTRYSCRFWTAGGARAGFLGEISEDGDTLTHLTAFVRGQGWVPRAHLSRRGLSLVIFVEPEPPEACAASPMAPDLAFFADPRPQEACVRTLGERRERGGVPLPLARAWRERGAVPPWIHILAAFVDPRLPKACARTLGEGCGRGGAPLTSSWRAQKGHGAPQSSREALCSSHDEC